MSVPTYEELMLPFLEALGELGQASVATMREAIATKLSLPQSAQEELLPSGKQGKFASRVGWAKTYLSRAGLVTTVSRGVVELTDAGRAYLNSNPVTVNKDALLQFDSFRRWLAESNTGISSEPKKVNAQELPHEQLSPEEAIADGYGQLVAALADEVIETLLGVQWQRFEEIVIDVLQALGYGGNRAGAGRAFRTTGDEGVDGVIDEDPLGLSKVYVQAKKYAVERPVGRPEVQAFVGSLLGKKSKQGVFITTSKFTNEASAYAESLSDLRIVLINGRTLAQLMINSGVGVAEQDRYIIRRLDRDYFEQ